MAHHSATLKSIRQMSKRNEANTDRRTQVKSSIKKVITAIEAKDHKTAQEALVNAQSNLFKAVTKGVIKKHTAARKVSRLNTAIKAIATK
jgi:small subunit ribosomal protein S20